MSEPRCVYDHSNAGPCEGNLYNPDNCGNAICDKHRRTFTTPTWDHVDELADEIERLREKLKKATEWGRGQQARAASHERRIEELEPAVEDADARVDEAWHEGHKEANAELCGRIERLREAIFWACGVNGTFRLREDGEGQFWWRKELRELAGISGEELNRRALAEIGGENDNNT